MVQYNKERTTAVFYPNGTCNLKCRYCNIDKNPALVKVDKILEESFKDPEYYLKRTQLYFKKWQLTKVETWGGEPFLGMHRILPLFHKLIEYYPNLIDFYSSTNFSYPTWFTEVENLFNVFAAYPNRKFKYNLQLSIDGPQELNDFNRGQGVTERCLENYERLLNYIRSNKLPSNITLLISPKNTLDTDSVRSLNTKQAIIDYYRFFEDNYIDPLEQLVENHPNVSITYSVPNMAVPTPATVEFSKLFAKFIRLCREVEMDADSGLKYYRNVTPFSESSNNTFLTYKYPRFYCGTGNSMVGFLPDDLIAICNEGFTEMVKEYNENANTGKYRREDGSITFRQYIDTDRCILCLTDEQYAIHEQKMQYYNNCDTTARLVSIVTEIIALAMAGQVDSRYLNEIEALKAAIMISARVPYCIKDNYNSNGTTTLMPLGNIKLFLNGALEFLATYEEQEEFLSYDAGQTGFSTRKRPGFNRGFR